MTDSDNSVPRPMGGEEPDRDAVPSLDRLLDAPLTAVALPTRLETFCARRGLHLVRDLVAIAPAALLVEKNLGRKSVADGRVALANYLGASWESARGMLGPPRPTPPRTHRDVWAILIGTLSESALETRLDNLALPARMRSFAATRGLVRVADLVALPHDELLQAPNMGRTTVADVLNVLSELAKSAAEQNVGVAPDPLPEGSNWSDLLRAALRGLDGNDRLVAKQRSGLAGPIPTLAEIGESLGVSRERIRQLEARALDRIRTRPWRKPAARRLDDAAPRDFQDAAAAGRSDPLFELNEEDAAFFPFFVNEVIAGSVHVVTVDGRMVLTRCTRGDLESHIKRAREAARNLAFPFAKPNHLEALAAKLGITREDLLVLADSFANEWIEEGDLVTGFGGTRRDAVLAFLRSADGPIERATIEERFGRLRIPDEAVFLDWGLVTVAEKVPEWERWTRRLPALVKQVIEENGPDRQWATTELVPLLAERAELPDWLNGWSLGSLLRAVPSLRYLGRNVVALLDAGEDRIHIRDTVVEILERAGAPMLETTVIEALRNKRGLGAHTWNLLRFKKPFLLLAGEAVGLEPRDIPGGPSAMDQVTSAVFNMLDERQLGIRAADLRAILAGFGAAFRAWDIRLLMSVLRHDGRFRLQQGGAVGLREWESIRAPTQTAIVEELLQKHGGSVEIAVVTAAIPTFTGEPIDRNRLGLLVNSVGASLVGDRIAWTAEPNAPRDPRELVRQALASVPEKTAALFSTFVAASFVVTDLRSELGAWESRLREEARNHCRVEEDQLDRLVAVARQLLVLCEEHVSDSDGNALRCAAVRYLTCVDDAESDLAVGGLDDDESLLDVVRQLTTRRRTG